MIRRKSFVVLLFAVLCAPLAAMADETGASKSIQIGVETSIWSQTLGENRPLRIYTPPSQQERRAPAAVLYLLDGANNFVHTAAAVDFLIGTGRIPEMIVVGIPNLDRGKDLTPGPTGGDRFLTFLTTELAPWVERRYQTAPFRIIAGHSRGGLFTLNTLLNHPEAFNGYIAMSPALWWNNQAVLGDMEAKLKRLPPRRFLYMTDGDEAEQLTSSVAKSVAVLERAAPNNLEWHYTRLKNEEHMSTPHRSIYDGLENMFSGMQVPRDLLRAQGLKGIEQHYAALPGRYGFDIPLPLGMVDWCGYYLMQQGKPEMAVDVFRHNVELNPLSIRVYGSLATALTAAGRQKEALEALNKAYQLAEAP
ncbi:alpha/beta hydrolase [Peristeroidobacter soli]|uniref:alpha/beta hydrolase n=1 Tax=Peristeroidobacter soli TaxID=2497877 RepID=UPI00101DD44B|nr:alpha/beta hydrolase-fold protein [Peristeroidobacter soli]